MDWLIVAIIVIAAYFLFRSRARPEVANFSVIPPNFVVVDIETTGLDPDKHQIIEIAAVKVNRDSNHHTTLRGLVKIEGKVPKKITEITGITTEMLEQGGEPLEAVIAEFLQFFGDQRLVFFNAPFDLGFLSKAAARIDKEIDNPVSCALDMARRAWPGQKSYKLANLARTFGLSTEGNHRALKDCELTITVYGAAAVQLNSAR